MDGETLSASVLTRFIDSMDSGNRGGEETRETQYRGKVVRFDQNGMAWCELEGADGDLTPVENLTTRAKIGDVLTISIKDGIATGGTSSANKTVTEAYVNALVKAIAGDTDALGEYLAHGDFEDITAQRANIGDLHADTATIGLLSADTADIANLSANNMYAATASFDKTIQNSVEAVRGKFDTLEVNVTAKMKKITAEWIKAARLEVEKLIANEAIIANLKAENATIMELLASDAYIGNLIANNAAFQNMIAAKADINLANIDVAEINAAKIQDLMAGSGWFTKELDVTGDSTITGQLKAVLIDGDTARFRNIYADALMLFGKDGLYHRLNYNGYDESTDYFRVIVDGTESPKNNGWFEIVDDEYVGTSDSSVISGEEKFTSETLEISDGSIYVLTRDLQMRTPVVIEWEWKAPGDKEITKSELITAFDNDGGYYFNDIVEGSTIQLYLDGGSDNFLPFTIQATDGTYVDLEDSQNNSLGQLSYDGTNDYLEITIDDENMLYSLVYQVSEMVYEESHPYFIGTAEDYGPVSYDGDKSFVFSLDSEKQEAFHFVFYEWFKPYYEKKLTDAITQELADAYGDELDNRLHGSNIIAETITATQIDASSIRTALLEADEIQVGINTVPHMRMFDGMLGFYPGSTITYNEVLEYEPVVFGEDDDISSIVPAAEGWYVALSNGSYKLTTDDHVYMGPGSVSILTPLNISQSSGSYTISDPVAYNTDIKIMYNVGGVVTHDMSFDEEFVSDDTTFRSYFDNDTIPEGSGVHMSIKCYRYMSSSVSVSTDYEVTVDSFVYGVNVFPEEWITDTSHYEPLWCKIYPEYLEFGSDSSNKNPNTGVNPGAYDNGYHISLIELSHIDVDNTYMVLSGQNNRTHTDIYGDGSITVEYDGDQTINYSITQEFENQITITGIDYFTYNGQGHRQYYSLNESYIHASPRSRRWYELDPEKGYFRSTDPERVPNKVYYDGVENSVAYITNQELYIPRSVVTDKQALGTPELGQWMWEISDGQNLSLSWVGKETGMNATS